MNRKLTTITTVLLCAVQGIAQGTPSYFNTIGIKTHNAQAVVASECSNTMSPSEDKDNSMPSTEQLDAPVKKHEKRPLDTDSMNTEEKANGNPFINTETDDYKHTINTESSVYKRIINVKTMTGKGKVRSYYNWSPRELNLENLKDVVSEVGLSNKLFVLAQAVLETGNFSSRVCKENNNLFGLYDSKHKEYFRFARWEDSVVGYGRMVQHRYKGGNYLDFLRRIGYAEDPKYITKVARLARSLYHKLFEQ